MGDAFGSFTGNPNGLPVDTHEMVAMVAPRGLFIMDNPHIANLGPRSGSVAALGGAEVYKALGAGDNITYWSDVSDGSHCANRPGWRTPLQQNIQKFLLKTGTAPGVMRISSKAAGNLASGGTGRPRPCGPSSPSTSPSQQSPAPAPRRAVQAADPVAVPAVRSPTGQFQPTRQRCGLSGHLHRQHLEYRVHR